MKSCRSSDGRNQNDEVHSDLHWDPTSATTKMSPALSCKDESSSKLHTLMCEMGMKTDQTGRWEFCQDGQIIQYVCT